MPVITCKRQGLKDAGRTWREGLLCMLNRYLSPLSQYLRLNIPASLFIRNDKGGLIYDYFLLTVGFGVGNPRKLGCLPRPWRTCCFAHCPSSSGPSGVREAQAKLEQTVSLDHLGSHF